MIDLRRIERGLYLIHGTRYAIGYTPDSVEGPRGGTYGTWELRRWDGGWIIEPDPGWRTLRDARAHLEANPRRIWPIGKL
jgi:hypothetical protein